MAKRIATLVAAVVLASAFACRSEPRGPDFATLIADLKGPDEERSGRARLALISIGEPAVPALKEMAKSDDSGDRLRAVTTLWGMGLQARSAVPELATALSDRDHEVRVTAAMALESIGPAAAPAVRALIKALRDKEGRVRQWSAKALGKIGPAASAAIPALVEASKFDPVRPAAEEAIRQIQGGE